MSQKYELQQSIVNRVAKYAIPEHMSVSKESKELLNKAAGLFILYLSSTANEQAQAAKRKTMTTNDVMLALESMEYSEMFTGPLNTFLTNYRLKSEAKNKVAMPEPLPGASEGMSPPPVEIETERDDERDENMEAQAKKQKSVA